MDQNCHLSDLVDAPFGRFGAWPHRSDVRRRGCGVVVDVGYAYTISDRKQMSAGKNYRSQRGYRFCQTTVRETGQEPGLGLPRHRMSERSLGRSNPGLPMVLLKLFFHSRASGM